MLAAANEETGESTSEEDGTIVVTNATVTSKPLPIIGEVYSDRKKIADNFSKLQVSLRIIPSQNDEGGFVVMKSTNENNAEEDKLGEKVDVGDNYFLFTETADYFPVLRIDKEHGPFGSASPICIHLDWAKFEQRKMYDMYHSVLDFPNCTNAFNPKFRWQRNDPKTGVDFKAWKQRVSNVESEGDCNHIDGLYFPNAKNTGGKCYTYSILKRVCLMIAFKEHPKT